MTSWKHVAGLALWAAVALGFTGAGHQLVLAYSASTVVTQQYPLAVGLLSAAVGIFLLLVLLWALSAGLLTKLLLHLGHRRAARASMSLIPFGLRKILVATLGLSLLTSPAVAIDLGFTGDSPSEVSITEPVSHVSNQQVPVSKPKTKSSPEKLVEKTRQSKAQESVVVLTGDTLWSIAAAELGEDASPVEVSARWQQWYQENEAVIGTDPDVIKPGMVLTSPAAPDQGK